MKMKIYNICNIVYKFMVKIFGRRISHGNIQHLGRKIGHKADVIGRKALNTVDKVAPIASTLALLAGQPGIASAINQGLEGAHQVNDTVRGGIKEASRLNHKSVVQQNMNGNMQKTPTVSFGDEAPHLQRVHALLRG
jgi:hypothetical protein